jgi:hypothetical protein
VTAARAYYCPMHSDVHAVGGGKCPHCHMDLVPEGSKLGIVRHMLGSPLHLAVMIALMLAIMAALMMMPR